MLEELLATAFVVCCSVEAAPLGFAEPPLVAVALSPHPSPQELTQLTPPRVGHPDIEFGDVATLPGFAEPPLVAVVPLPQPLAQELALLTPPRVGQPDIEIGDETLTPREAARCLARFLDEVRVEREPPLVVSPPRQPTRARRPLPVRRRSTRIAAQPLAHIPASPRGEVLLKQRLGIAPPAAMVSPAPKGILDALRSGALSSSQVDALDALFPVVNGRACELFMEDP
jgi:hypothetical protein